MSAVPIVISTPCAQRKIAEETFRVLQSSTEWELVAGGRDHQTNGEDTPTSCKGVSIVTSSLPTDHTVLLALNHILTGVDVGLFFSDGNHVFLKAATTRLASVCRMDGGVENVVSDMVNLPYQQVLTTLVPTLKV